MGKIFLVDDEPMWRDLCRERLQNLGHEVLAVDGNWHALEMLALERPDLVILDLRMAVSGRSMLEVLRRRRPNVPVIIHTVYGGYEDDPGMASVDGFVVKSPDLTALVSTVDAVLRRRGLALQGAPR